MLTVQNAAKAGLRYEDAQLPLIMRAVYGKQPPRFIVLLRDPIDRMHTGYHG